MPIESVNGVLYFLTFTDGREEASKEIKIFYSNRERLHHGGIATPPTTRRPAQKKRGAERLNRTLFNMVRKWSGVSKLEQALLDEITTAVAYAYNHWAVLLLQSFTPLARGSAAAPASKGSIFTQRVKGLGISVDLLTKGLPLAQARQLPYFIGLIGQ
ncbi:hypothetical protein K437DRAFT_265202 [Tilletiaria anomala UBC 951]|uniref:Uncharacterized protein n=1 Tax=Tilletiaria anomala (strain ATCC 24038 / CBS 436.72 / UBC 951) TaxID=1037660 RepID=A0A066VDL4_TILAU|nr:uncharacterized protein K437DRAFT_265202 [Tilletiaria anomala UBC 951]KDN36829.1 hypothetical protein K437DRAFT_265202 [Tilletiaria anomala UBC 951]